MSQLYLVRGDAYEGGHLSSVPVQYYSYPVLLSATPEWQPSDAVTVRIMQL